MAIRFASVELMELHRILGVEADFSGPGIGRLREADKKLDDIRNKAVRKAIAAMIRDLYDLDTGSIGRDMARIAMADWEKDIRPEPWERMKLLRALWWVFGVYYDGDYGELARQCSGDQGSPGRSRDSWMGT